MIRIVTDSSQRLKPTLKAGVISASAVHLHRLLSIGLSTSLQRASRLSTSLQPYLLFQRVMLIVSTKVLKQSGKAAHPVKATVGHRGTCTADQALIDLAPTFASR